ncbi:hypothetical protein D9756_010239 [Leucocoprinus leucothites]|uniref:F-box domain-containing protein n=1 Tax=Leucocoprinus leucothites TaxID=201217 RepID=A0A8H5CUF9_9AGAR|nr:hypothetical protein D9756_010239 [Leucoagaricus leucothites]
MASPHFVEANEHQGLLTKPCPSLPLDVVGEIASNVRDKETWRSASVVSHIWRVAFRPKFFSSIVLGNRFNNLASQPTSATKERLLSFVISVKIRRIITAFVDTGILSTLNKLPNLKNLDVTDAGSGWDRATPESIKQLVQLLGKESLRTLTVKFSAVEWSGFPLLVLPYCRNVRVLDLEDTTVLYPLFHDDQHGFSALKQGLASLKGPQHALVPLHSLRLEGTALISRFLHFHLRNTSYISPDKLRNLELDYVDSKVGARTASSIVGQFLKSFGGSVRELAIGVCRPWGAFMATSSVNALTSLVDAQAGLPLEKTDLSKLCEVQVLNLTLTTAICNAPASIAAFPLDWACQLLQKLPAKENILRVGLIYQLVGNCDVALSQLLWKSLDLLWKNLDSILGELGFFPRLQECTIISSIGVRDSEVVSGFTLENWRGMNSSSIDDRFSKIKRRKVKFVAIHIERLSVDGRQS